MRLFGSTVGAFFSGKGRIPMEVGCERAKFRLKIRLNSDRSDGFQEGPLMEYLCSDLSGT
jgi:hypothetical protein